MLDSTFRRHRNQSLLLTSNPVANVTQILINLQLRFIVQSLCLELDCGQYIQLYRLPYMHRSSH